MQERCIHPSGASVQPAAPRRAFTTFEVMVALGLLSIAIVLLSQAALGQVAERQRQLGRQHALDAAANILESARLIAPEALTPQWAASQRLPESLAKQLFDSRLDVTVEPYGGEAKIKRVKVRIRWKYGKLQSAAPVILIGCYGPRSLTQAEGKP